MNRFMKIAADEAVCAVKGSGGPFGAVIVKEGRIVAKANNSVVRSRDPTAHAEINAIRQASRKLGFDLSGCELYTSCEPCPMCLAAAYWARIKKIYYGCTRDDAQRIGFDDKRFYEIIGGKAKKGKIPSKNIDREYSLRPFEMWEKKKSRVKY